MRLSVIIPTKERDSIFAETLRCAVDAVSQIEAEIIVVNDSKSSTPEIPQHLSRVKLLANFEKWGCFCQKPGGKKRNR